VSQTDDTIVTTHPLSDLIQTIADKTASIATGRSLSHQIASGAARRLAMAARPQWLRGTLRPR
jgi:hypothetical protein